MRIEGDGSVKLILADKDNVCADTDNDGIIDNSTDTSSYIGTGTFGETERLIQTI